MAERKQIDTSTVVFDNGSEREIFFYYGELPTGGTYSAGETVNAVQGEIATYRFTYTNEIVPQTIQFDIDFGGAIGVDSQIVSFVSAESKVVEFTKLIPINEGTPRTATITDNVGGTPYAWQYEIMKIISFIIDTTIGYTHYTYALTENNDKIMPYINWGDGFIQTNVQGDVNAGISHIYNQALSNITIVIATPSNNKFTTFRSSVNELNADNFKDTLISCNVAAAAVIGLNNKLQTLDLSTYPLISSVNTIWQTSLSLVNLDNTLITTYAVNRTNLGDGLFLRNCPNLLSVTGDNRGSNFEMDVTGSLSLDTISTDVSYIVSIVGLSTTNISYVKITNGGTVGVMNAALQSCVDVGNSNGYFEMAFTPDTQGAINKATLISRGWTVNTL